MKTRTCITIILLCALWLTGCGANAIIDPTSTPAPTDAPPAREETSPPAEDTGDEEETSLPTADEESAAQPPQPQTVNFESADGTALAGTFYPSRSGEATGILFMHWLPGQRTDWQDLIAFLQAESGQDFAYFTFDFRGHGDSGGKSNDRAEYIDDGIAALETFRTMPGVNPDAVLFIGGSIGADAVADSCGEGCIGVISLSPGNYTGMAYSDALSQLGDKPVLCVASENDGPSPKTCNDGEAMGLSDYSVHIYQGRAHAMEMFDLDQEPHLDQLILDWLLAHLP